MAELLVPRSLPDLFIRVAIGGAIAYFGIQALLNSPHPPPKNNQGAAEQYGGEDNPADYVGSDTVPSCDKYDHSQRSINSQPNHLNFWKKAPTPIPPCR